ncbi:hypothetical protein [Streptomyces buecherae]
MARAGRARKPGDRGGAFGLVFGAFDFGIDHDGRTWLYECNPNGQFA